MVSDLEYGDMQVIVLMFSSASASFPTQGQKHLLQFQLGNSLPVRLLSQIVVESFQLFSLGQQTVQLFLLLFPFNLNVLNMSRTQLFYLHFVAASLFFSLLSQTFTNSFSWSNPFGFS